MNPELLFRSRSNKITGWRGNNVFEKVNSLETGTKILTVRWVDSWKQVPMGTKTLKSRCVIKGNQENYTNLSTYAPTSTKEMTMFISSVAAINKWDIETLDVEKAFLQSRELTRNLYVKPPKEVVGNYKTKVWKLRTAVCGLGDAAREWYLTAKRTLTDLELRES